MRGKGNENMEKLVVLYEDNQIIVVLKPHNVPTQADASGDDDLLSMVKQYVKEKYNKEGEAFIGLVHRLDRPTGGIMVFARNSKSAARLSAQFASHDTKKTYYAVTTAVPQAKTGRLKHNLKKDEKNNSLEPPNILSISCSVSLWATSFLVTSGVHKNPGSVRSTAPFSIHFFMTV